MEELNQHKTPLERARENPEANEKICRPVRLGPVRPLSPTVQTGRAEVQKTQTGQTGIRDRSDRLHPDRSQTKLQTQISSKRSPNLTKLGG